METLETLFDHYAKEHHFAGAVLIQGKQQTIFEQAYGYAHRGFSVPNTTKTRFDTASVTKLFTAVAVLQLVDQGKLQLEDRITDIIDLTGTAIPADVTLAHLLTHTSGIADDADEELGESYEALFVDKPNYSIRDCADFLPQFAYKAPKFKAGSNISYNNCAFILLGLAIEKVTGVSYREYVVQHIIRTCGMDHTAFISKDNGDEPVAEGYDAVQDEGGTVRWKKNIYAYPPIGTADGGAFTTVGDLDRFMRALVDGQLLSSERTAAILKPQTALVQEYVWGTVLNGYGFHFAYDRAGKLIRMHKEGSNAGVAVMFAYYPELAITLTILANQSCDVWELHEKAEHLIRTDTATMENEQ